VPTIAAMLEEVKFEGEFKDTKFAKNLFFYDKNKKERMWLVITAHDTAFSTKSLEKKFACKNGGLRGATPEVLEEVLGVKGGSVNLFAMMNDKENKKVTLVIDHTLLKDHAYVGFHPMQNDFTTALKKEDVKKVIELSGCVCEEFDFSSLGEAPAPVEKKPQGEKKPQPPKEKKAEKIADAHQLGIEYKKEDNFSKWYA